jgi:hypothetical protein
MKWNALWLRQLNLQESYCGDPSSTPRHSMKFSKCKKWQWDRHYGEYSDIARRYYKHSLSRVTAQDKYKNRQRL